MDERELIKHYIEKINAEEMPIAYVPEQYRAQVSKALETGIISTSGNDDDKNYDNTDREITNDNIQSLQLKELESIHFWIKFWSVLILSLWGCLIIFVIIGWISNLKG